jgi:predicted TPR repeat methyltransferase
MEGDEAEIGRLIRDGDEHIRQGRGSDADACFRQVLEIQPDHPDALHRRGLLAFLRGDPREAIDFLSRAMAIRGDDATLCGHLASAHMACGNADDAIANWRRALEIAPDYAAAHVKLGDAYSAKGELESSETSYRKAVALTPDDPRAFVGLARALLFSGRDEEGESVLHQALELSQGAPDVVNLVGTVLLEAGGLDAALELFEASVRGEPDQPRGHAGMGLALHMLGRSDEAEGAYRKALGTDPGNALALKHLGVLLQERGELEAAAECFRDLLASNPDDDVARHMLAATTGDMTTGAPAGYVTRLFDDYADRFDAHLNQISYRVPELIRDAVVEVAGSENPGWRILDLGCGTGQCGEILRPLAEFLAGVDLSPRMVAKSRARNVYDSLATRSIDEALEGQEQTFDLIVAGDVFTYVGDLSGVMERCSRALRPGGLMAFSVEDADGEGFELRPTGRYAHSSSYIDALAAASSLSLAYRREMSLRDDPVPIPGRIVVLSKAP